MSRLPRPAGAARLPLAMQPLARLTIGMLPIAMLTLAGLAASGPAHGQTMSIEEYEPKSTLVVPGHPVPRAKFPFVDVHNHQDLATMSAADMDRLVKEMDSIDLRVMVNLSGGSGDELARSVANVKAHHPGRIVVFANLDFKDLDGPGYGARAAERLAKDVANGAVGLKIFKNFGMTVKDTAGARVPVDDTRLDAVFAKCGELDIPVLIHTAEPASFFEPIDKTNERWLELKQFPQRARPPETFPPWEQLMAEQRHLFAKHPKTRFINAHLGWLGGNLARLGELLDALPNVSTEIGAVLAELGRQPRFARAWFIKYQDRVMFGKDTWAVAEYPVYFRVLESSDEYFDYYRKRHAFWKMYGLDLPDEVLKKLYFKNARRVIPGIPKEGWTE
ncbi:MAG: amidohydrolase family protein [Thermoanaerobaculia bacterium]